MNLYIKISSYHYSFIKKFINNVEILLKSNNINYSLYNLKLKNDKYTILRSPHVNKSARDQFQKTTYKKKLKIKLPLNFSIIRIKQLITILKTLTVGVKINITFKK